MIDIEYLLQDLVSIYKRIGSTETRVGAMSDLDDLIQDLKAKLEYGGKEE